MTYRIGVFLTFSGVLVSVLAILTALTGSPLWLMCTGGPILLLLGIFLVVRYLPRSEPVQRFSLVNKFRNPTKKEKP